MHCAPLVLWESQPWEYVFNIIYCDVVHDEIIVRDLHRRTIGCFEATVKPPKFSSSVSIQLCNSNHSHSCTRVPKATLRVRMANSLPGQIRLPAEKARWWRLGPYALHFASKLRYLSGLNVVASLPHMVGSLLMAHILANTVVPAGMWKPANTASSRLQCGMASGVGGWKRKTSFNTAYNA